jgi:hypothetical protein
MVQAHRWWVQQQQQRIIKEEEERVRRERELSEIFFERIVRHPPKKSYLPCIFGSLEVCTVILLSTQNQGRFGEEAKTSRGGETQRRDSGAEG